MERPKWPSFAFTLNFVLPIGPDLPAARLDAAEARCRAFLRSPAEAQPANTAYTFEPFWLYAEMVELLR